MKISRMLCTTVAASVAAIGMLGIGSRPANANTDSVSGSPLTCTTNPDFGNQVASWTSQITDDHDPAAVGDTLTYRFVVPFAQNPPPVAANYRGGTVNYKIPTGFSVTSVSTQPVEDSAQMARQTDTSTCHRPLQDHDRR